MANVIGALKRSSLGQRLRDTPLGRRLRRAPAPDRFEGLLRDFGYRVDRVEEQVAVATPDAAPRHPIYVRLDKADPSIFEEIFIAEQYSLDHTRVGRRIERVYQRLAETHVPLILDLGANVGYASIYYARRYPRAAIVGIECDAENFAWLRKNTAPFSNILPVHGAVDAESGRPVRVTDRDEESVASVFRSCRYVVTSSDEPAAGGTQLVRTYTVAELAAEATARHAAASPFLCKVDIEGYERQLFSRDTEWLASFHVLIGEGHDHVFPGQRTAHGMLRSAMRYGFDIMTASSNFLAVRYE